MKIYVATLMHVELRGNILRMVQTPSRPSSSPAFQAPAPPLASLGYLRVTPIIRFCLHSDISYEAEKGRTEPAL